MLSATTYGELAEQYYPQARYLVECGVRLLETAQDILEVLTILRPIGSRYALFNK